MEIPHRQLPAELRELTRCLSRAELRSITADLEARGLAGTPTYAAWLRTELLKAAQRKQLLASAGVAA